MRPRLLDLFCGAGGAGVGYHRAGFDVVGVDLAPQKNYPFEFIQADAVEFLELLLDDGNCPRWGWFPGDFAAIHASPPCQHDSRMTNCRPGLADEYPQLIDATRVLLSSQETPWAIENVEGSGLATQDDLLGAHGLTLCGTMFSLPLYRHRLFETSFPVAPPLHPRHFIPASKAGHWKPGTIISVEGHCSPIALAREAMGGVDWMTRDELAESIPPAYGEYLGTAFLAHLSEARAA
jgi:DNA (cytosine-5)-methyltransferase 1